MRNSFNFGGAALLRSFKCDLLPNNDTTFKLEDRAIRLTQEKSGRKCSVNKRGEPQIVLMFKNCTAIYSISPFSTPGRLELGEHSQRTLHYRYRACTQTSLCCPPLETTAIFRLSSVICIKRFSSFSLNSGEATTGLHTSSSNFLIISLPLLVF